MKMAMFYPFSDYKDGQLLTGYGETEFAFDAAKDGDHVHTSQMCFLNKAWEEGYAVFIINGIGLPVYIHNGMKGVDKELRKEHNLFRLWAAGALGNHLLPILERVD